jgi:hypothetical protein
MSNNNVVYVSSIKHSKGSAEGMTVEFDLVPKANAEGFRLKGRLIEHLGAYDLTLKDFKFARQFAFQMREAAMEIESSKILNPERSEALKARASGLWLATISTFCRSFTDSDKWKKLDIREKLKLRDEKYLTGFNAVLNLRHKYVAHRDKIDYESVDEFLFISKLDTIPEFGLASFLGWMNVWDKVGYELFLDLLDTCESIVLKMRDDLTQMLLARFSAVISISEMKRCLDGKTLDVLIK